jgi:hypothetical protein
MIPSFLYEDLTTDGKHHLTHNYILRLTAQCPDLNRVFYDYGLRLEKNASGNVNFQPDGPDNDLDKVVGTQCADIIRRYVPNIELKE